MLTELDAIVMVALGALITGVASGLIGSWITVHVLKERLVGFERWLKALQADVKKVKDDLYRPSLPPGYVHRSGPDDQH